MRPIFLTDQQKSDLVKDIILSVEKTPLVNGAFHYSKSFLSKKGEKATIIYSSDAWLKIQGLIQGFQSEVFWHALIKRVSETEFFVYDVLVPEQTVTGSTVDTTDDDCLAFTESLTDEQAASLFYHGHSHVNMGTFASSVDLAHQKSIISSMGKQGFYIFQIMNKKGDCLTMLYDLDNNILYEENDVETEVIDENGNFMSDFFMEATKKVHDETPKPVKQKYGKGQKKEVNLPTKFASDFDTEEEYLEYLRELGYIL